MCERNEKIKMEIMTVTKEYEPFGGYLYRVNKGLKRIIYTEESLYKFLKEAYNSEIVLSSYGNAALIAYLLGYTKISFGEEDVKILKASTFKMNKNNSFSLLLDEKEQHLHIPLTLVKNFEK